MNMWIGGQVGSLDTGGQSDRWISGETQGTQVMLNKQRDVMARKVYLLLVALVNWPPNHLEN